MQRSIVVVSMLLAILVLPAGIFAASNTYRVQRGDTWESIAAKYHVSVQALADLNQPSNGDRVNVPAVAPTPTPTPTPPPPTPSPSPTPPPPATGEKSFSAYLTGYGFPDNTPPSAEISNPVIHSIAAGTGTYADPITIAVGHTITGGKDILDYAQGTKFYIPALRRYFIVEDTCGDGNSPQNGPCHTGFQGHVWLDAWVGGTIAQTSATLNCEDAITDFHVVIQNPASNYAVVSGPVFGSSCSQLYGDAVATQ